MRDRGRRHPWGEKVPPLPFPSRVSACEQYYAVVLCVYRGWGPTESAPPSRSRFAPCAEFVEVWGSDSEPGGWAEGRPAAAACKDQGGINKARHVTRTRREIAEMGEATPDRARIDEQRIPSIDPCACECDATTHLPARARTQQLLPDHPNWCAATATVQCVLRLFACCQPIGFK